jgi:hypothetical protein
LGKGRFAWLSAKKLSVLTYDKDNILLVTVQPNADSHAIIDLTEDIIDTKR